MNSRSLVNSYYLLNIRVSINPHSQRCSPSKRIELSRQVSQCSFSFVMCRKWTPARLSPSRKANDWTNLHCENGEINILDKPPEKTFTLVSFDVLLVFFHLFLVSLSQWRSSSRTMLIKVRVLVEIVENFVNSEFATKRKKYIEGCR